MKVHILRKDEGQIYCPGRGVVTRLYREYRQHPRNDCWVLISGTTDGTKLVPDKVLLHLVAKRAAALEALDLLAQRG